ncbi:MAG TPA: hypothetical protein VFU45_07820 [Gemmatimonadales bacterium]|nr:hypothetical protein [Gemmatimonadales bacterium]
MTRSLCVLASVLALATPLAAQDNYEIQVYGSETVAPAVTMLELHSNFTFDGGTTVVDGVRPTDHALHETVEVTHGFNDWFEVGFYFFTTAQDGGWHYVGSHIRPRVRVPPGWGWPVGASISQEIGCQDRSYATEHCNYEFRPIVDKQMGRFYWAVNPSLELALTGPDRSIGFAPSAKVSFDFSRIVTGGFEYYGGWGPVAGLLPGDAREEGLYPTIDLNVSPEWEVNAGVGIGLTPATDRLLAKLILGRRLGR